MQKKYPLKKVTVFKSPVLVFDFKLEFGRIDGEIILADGFPVIPAGSAIRRPSNPLIKMSSNLIKATSLEFLKKLPDALCPRYLNNVIKMW